MLFTVSRVGGESTVCTVCVCSCDCFLIGGFLCKGLTKMHMLWNELILLIYEVYR